MKIIDAACMRVLLFLLLFLFLLINNDALINIFSEKVQKSFAFIGFIFFNPRIFMSLTHITLTWRNRDDGPFGRPFGRIGNTNLPNAL